MTTALPVAVDEAPADAFDPAVLVAAGRPRIFRGLARNWPMVTVGNDGPGAAMDYLRRFDAGLPVTGFTGSAAIRGRFFYDDSATAFNFTAGRAPLADYLTRIAADLDKGLEAATAYYLGSTDVDTYLPGFRSENDLPLALDGPQPRVSLWIGNRTTAATHYDMSNNLACVLVGRRRFTLFPPNQVANLYPGPLEPTPAGQVVSMVDPRAPDLDRHPRFAEAVEHAHVAEMEPGDVLFYPALWWHNVEALDAFNVMMNYWWNPSPRFMDTPMNTILHGLLSLRDRPQAEKNAWRALFDYYVFGDAGEAAAHLPEPARGALAPIDELRARRLRAQLLNRLNR